MQWDSGTSFDTSWQTGVGAGNGGNILIGGGVGRVDTSGTSVTWVSGSLFRTSWTGTVTIAGVGYTISSCVSTNSCTLTTSAGSQSSVGYSVRGTPYGVATWNSSTVATLMEPPGTQAGVNYLDQTACVGGSATFLGNGCQNSVSEDTTIPGHVAGTNLITRIADQSTMYFGHSTGNFTRSEGDNDRDISANEKYLAFEVTGEEIQIAELTTAPGYVRVVNAGCAMPGIAPSAFGFTWNTDNEFYYITGSTLYSNTLSGTGCALAFGTPMVMAYLMGPGVCPGVTPFTAGSSSVLGISADDSTVFAALGPGGQGTADWVFAWSKTKGCATANFNTGQAWGYLAPGMCSTSACSEAIPPLGTFATGATNCWGSHGSSGDGIHDMVVTGDGLYAFITPQNGNWTQAGCANLSSGPMGYAVWQVGTLGNQWCSNNPGVNCGAHPAAGVSHFLTPNSHTGFNIRLDSDVQFDKSFLAPPPIEDEHLSWPHNDNGIFNDSLPWVGASDLALLSHASGCTGSGAYDSAVYCPTYLQNQIFAAFPHSVYPGEALIFSHTDECGYLPLSTYAQCADQIPENIGVAGAIGIVSPKGDFFCWGSSMLHNLGYDYLAAPQSSPFCLYLGVPQ
jgi:hypothetical protein